MLQRARDLELLLHTQEQRYGILGQTTTNMVCQLCAKRAVELLTFAYADGAAASAAVVIGELDAVDVRFVKAGVRAERFGDFGRADVFALGEWSVLKMRTGWRGCYEPSSGTYRQCGR
jgi:hypothetical protein